MNALRLVVVTPRYWPLVGPPEQGLAELVTELRRQGAQPTVVTPNWAASWPSFMWHRDVAIVRLPGAPKGGWASIRYLRELSRWLRAHQTEFDVALVANLRYEAYTTIGTLQPTRLPVVLRPEKLGSEGDIRWQATQRLGRRVRKRSQLADAVIAGTTGEVAELRRAGWHRAKIVEIPPGVTLPEARDQTRRAQARLALGDVNHDLATHPDTFVAACVSRLEIKHDLFCVVQAWQRIAERWPNAMLWILGDGPLRSDLYEQLVATGLHKQISLPGSFDDLEDVLKAVDLLIAPSSQPGLPSATLLGMASGLPLVAVATSDHRGIMQDEVEGLLVPVGDSVALADAIARLMDSPAFARQLGAAARARVARAHRLSCTASKHLELFAKLARGERGTA